MIIINDLRVLIDKPLLSIDIITYNHENFIVNTLEGVLMQITNFDYEIVICDDFSTDKTRDILINYQQKYPEKITLRFQEQNVGLRYNYFENKKACRGKYIAICEGDDYWTDPNKLQFEVDFLEANAAYSMVFTNSIEVFEFKNWTREPAPFRVLENRDYLGSELLLNWTVPTATVVYRNSISHDFVNIDRFHYYDIPLFLRLSECGKIRAFDIITAIYRKHDNAITSQIIPYKRFLSHLKALNDEFKGNYSAVLKKIFAKEYYFQAKKSYKNKSLKTFYFTFLSLIYDSSVLMPHVKRKFKELL